MASQKELQKRVTELETKLETVETERQQQAAVLDNINEVIYVADPDTYELLYVNGAFKKIWGDKVGQKCHKILQNLDTPCPFCTNDRIFNDSDEPYVWEFQNQISKGWFRCIDQAIAWPDGRKVRYEMAIDITKQKQVEEEREKLLGDLRRFSTMLDSTTDLAATSDLQGNINYMNAAGLKMLGREGQDPTTLSIPDFHTPEQAQISLQEHVAVVMEKGIHAWENVLRHTDGHDVLVSQVTMLICNEAGEPEGMGTIMRDISEQKQAETKLRDSEFLLQTFLNNFPDIAFAKDTEGRIILSNRILEAAFGAGESLVGKTVYDLVPKEAADQIWASEKQILETGELSTIEEQVPQAGELHTKLTTKFPLYNASGDVYAIGGVSIDITRQKQVEAEREKLQEEVIEGQRRAIAELSTPVIPIMDRIIVMPLVGSIDSIRARDITRILLAGISEHQAKVVILDVTGVSLMDTGIVNHLNKTIQAARLKGARTIVTGISDAVAESIVDLGIDWSDIETLSDLQTGLVTALKSLRVKLAK
jgi:PAS domain S-box-containing protein